MDILSIVGLYQWDNDILKPLTDKLTSFYPLSTDDLRDALLVECAEFEIMYTNPDVFKSVLRVWTTGEIPKWKRICDAIKAEYNITENYDRSEEWTDTGSGSGTTENKYKGYPSGSALVKANETDNSSSATNIHTGRVHGNIGVRSAQELVTQELELADKINIQDIIISDFKNRFCILVY